MDLLRFVQVLPSAGMALLEFLVIPVPTGDTFNAEDFPQMRIQNPPIFPEERVFEEHFPGYFFAATFAAWHMASASIEKFG